MKLRSYKNILEELHKRSGIILTISLWTYSSKRMTFEVPYDSIKNCFDWDMVLTGNKNGKVVFTTIQGKKYVYDYNSLKIAKLDNVEIPGWSESHEECV